MPSDITSTFASVSSTEGSNQPSGSTAISTNLDDGLRMIQALMAGWRDAIGWGGLRLTSVSGTNTITASVAAQGSITMAPTAYSTGMRFRFTPANDNTGATTLNVNSLGAKSIFLNGAALIGYELRTNSIVEVEYDGTQFKIISGAHGDGVPVATVVPFAGATAPSGYLLCGGQAVSRTTYATLFAVISTTYGTGDGSTTFNVPDLRGRIPAGKDDMVSGAASRLTSTTITGGGATLGNVGGAQTHTLVASEVPNVTASRTDDGGSSQSPSALTDGTARNQRVSVGGGGAHNNVQPSIIVNYAIKV